MLLYIQTLTLENPSEVHQRPALLPLVLLPRPRQRSLPEPAEVVRNLATLHDVQLRDSVHPQAHSPVNVRRKSCIRGAFYLS